MINFKNFGNGKITERFRNLKLPRFSFAGKWKEKLQSDEMTSLSAKLKRHWSRKRIRTAALIGAGVFLVGLAFIYSQVRVLHHYRLLSSVERSDNSATSYVRLGGRTLKCNPNGVTCVNDSNDVQWNVTFTMQKPIVDTCGSVVAVGDQRGQDIYVFDRNGQIGHFAAEHTLAKLRVAEQGVVAAVLADGEITWINVYDAGGSLLVSARTSMDESGYPLDVDLSADGQKMAVSYLTMDNRDVKTNVAFYNFSSVGQSESDYLVNSVSYEGTVAPQVNFLHGNYAVAFLDNGLTFFGGKQVPEEKTQIRLDQDIRSICYSDDYIGVVTESDEEDREHKYKIQVYRANGSKCGTQYFDMDYSDIKLSGKEIILFNASQIEIYGIDGNKEASVEYEKEILDIIRLGGLRKYEVVTPDSTDKIRLS